MPIGLEDILVNNAAGFTIASARDNNVRGIYWVATTGDRDLIGDASLSTSDLRSQYTICIVGGDIYIYTNSSIADLDWTNKDFECSNLNFDIKSTLGSTHPK